MSYLCSSGIRSWFRIWFFITYMANKKVYIETYGCQMNVNDTEVIFSILKKAGPDTPAKAIAFSLPTSEVAGFGFFDS